MARPRILDHKIMLKIARKSGKKGLPAVNNMVSKKAAKLGISAEAALVILAKQYNIGTSTYQRKLDTTKQAELRDTMPVIFAPTGRSLTDKRKLRSDGSRPLTSKRAALKMAIEYLIQDHELRSRCQDILMAPTSFDRPINQATLVLEDRIRRKSQPTQRLVGENLVGYAFNEDLSKSVLRVSSHDPEDQRGFTQILRGIVPSFRNKTHHHIINSFSREEAIRVCGFIDVLLRVVDGSTKTK